MGIETILLQIVIGAAVSGASYGIGKLLAPKQKKAAPAPVQVAAPPDPLSNYEGPGGALPGLFGHRRVAGKTIFQSKINNVTYLVQIILGDRATGVDAIYINNDLVTTNSLGFVENEPWANSGTSSMSIQIYTGSQLVADPWLTAAMPNWNAQFVGRELTYAVIRINPAIDSVKFATTYNAGVPDFTYHVRGFKCYDPRVPTCVLGDTNTYIFSVNASIIEANYLIHRLGADFDTGWIDWSSVASCATIDDESVPLASGGAERRYTAALYWMTDELHEQVLERIGAAHAGGARPMGAKFRMTTGAIPAESATIMPSSYAGEGLTVTDRVPLKSRVNGVRGTFISPSDNYEPRDWPATQGSTWVTEDGGREEWLDLNLDCVTSHSQAQRLGRIALLRARTGYPASVTTNMSHFNITADDLTRITDLFSGIDQTFRVQSDQIGDDGTIDFDLTFENSGTFEWQTGYEKAYESSPPVAGETGAIRPGGAALYDSSGTATIIPNLAIWPSPSTIPNAVNYRYVDPNGVTRWTGAISAVVSANVTAINAATSMSGDHRLDVLDASNNVITSMAVSVPGSLNYGSLSDLSATTTPYYQMPASPTPLLLYATSGEAKIFVGPVTSVIKAQNMVLYRSASSSFATSTPHLTQPVSASGNEFTVTGTPGDVAFFWAVMSNATDGKSGYNSKALLVVF